MSDETSEVSGGSGQLPAACSAYPGDDFAVRVGVNAQQDSDPGRANIWTVTANYSESRAAKSFNP